MDKHSLDVPLCCNTQAHMSAPKKEKKKMSLCMPIKAYKGMEA
jgi:hypothetical protein